VHIAIKTIGGVAGLAALAWAGARVQPPRFPSPEWESRPLRTVALPAGLPRPVARYAETVFGDSIPVVETALIIGRVDMVIGGIPCKGRFKFFHQAGAAYYHEIQITWFGLPLITVDEQYKDGQAIMHLPFAQIENDERTNRSANLGLWAEAIWLPSIWFIDDRVRWIAVDDSTARLVVPDAAEEERLTMAFDARTSLVTRLSTLRYAASDDPSRHPWTNSVGEWGEMNGVRIPLAASTRWDDDKPWAVWTVDDVIYNLDVSARFATFGRGARPV
jgi:hypothetical protein